MEKQNSEKC